MGLPKIRFSTVRAHAAVAAGAWLFDAFVWGGAGLGFLAELVGCLIGAVQVLRGVFGARDRMLTGALVTLVYVVALALSGVALDWHGRGARARAQPIIDALDAYHAAHGDYPRSLAELTPSYLPSIPRAKYTLWEGEYWFAPAVPERHAQLLFVLYPPTGCRYFDFETRQWGTTR
jgi:hypothetical protein